MRVLHVFKTYFPRTQGGIEQVIFEIAEASAILGNGSLVLSTGQQGRPSHASAVGHHLSHVVAQDLEIASTPFAFALFSQFRRLIREVDVVHYHFPWPTMDLLELTNWTGIPRLVTYHSDVVRQRALGLVYRPLMHRFLGRMDAIVATSPAYAATSTVLQIHASKVRTIPIGIADAAPANPNVVNRWRSLVGQGFFLFVGVLRYYKGLTYLLDAARRSGLPVVIAGAGEMKDELAAGKLPNVKLIGAISNEDRQALLELSRAFVLPSHLRSEAFGVALLEAARAGRPMISCEIGTGTTFVNRHEETGLVVGPADGFQLAEAMLRLSRSDSDTDRFGRNARARYQGTFTAEAMGRAYLKLYEELCEGRLAH